MDTAGSPRSIRSIGVEDLDVLWAGAQIYGSAIGGHDLAWLVAWTRALLAERGPVPLVRAADLGQGNCAAVLVMGTMTSLLGLMPTGDEVSQAVDAFVGRTGRPLDAVYPLDAATINALIPLAAAAQLGLPLVDCDGMGRIFPMIHQTSLYLAGMPVGPIAAASPTGDTVVVDSEGSRADSLMRSMLDQLGGWALTVMHPCSASELDAAGLHGTVSRLLKVGHLIRDSASAEELSRRLAAEVGSWMVGRGPVVAVEHGTPRGEVALPSLPSSVVVVERTGSGRVIQLEVQNEILVAMVDGRVVAAVPDTICLLDWSTGEIVGTDQVHVGDDIGIIVLPSAAVWHTKAGLALVGPGAFGIPIEHPGGPR
jgi:DUF917 family protein